MRQSRGGITRLRTDATIIGGVEEYSGYNRRNWIRLLKDRSGLFIVASDPKNNVKTIQGPPVTDNPVGKRRRSNDRPSRTTPWGKNSLKIVGIEDGRIQTDEKSDPSENRTYWTHRKNLTHRKQE